MSGDIALTDWHRILIGDVPASFYLETIFRAVFIYAVLIVSMRLLGRRMAAQLSMTELAALVSLAAAVGVPLLSPDRGLLAAVVIAIVIVAIGRWSARLSMRSANTEAAIDGKISPLVEEAVLNLDAMKDARITRERVFAQLRSAGVTQLGKVRRLYLEETGSFTLVPETPPKPGLSVMPDWDEDFVREQKPRADWMVRANCGKHRASGERDGKCGHCGAAEWVAAVE